MEFAKAFDAAFKKVFGPPSSDTVAAPPANDEADAGVLEEPVTIDGMAPRDDVEPYIENSMGVRAPAPDGVVTLCLRGWELVQELEHIKTALADELEDNAIVVVPDLCRTEKAVAQRIEVTSINHFNELFGMGMSAYVQEERKFKPTRSLREILKTPSHDLYKKVRPGVQMTPVVSIRWKESA
ncbi:MAG: hypothetical protein HQL66_00610 [Magnetococcales bacterium]|nr:hypothetical protein [Magnetococcales bacterium]